MLLSGSNMVMDWYVWMRCALQKCCVNDVEIVCESEIWGGKVYMYIRYEPGGFGIANIMICN